MVSSSRLWFSVCAALLLASACDDGHKSNGKSNDDAGPGEMPGGDGDTPGGDGDGSMDAGCVYCDAGPDGAVIDLPKGSVGGFVFSHAVPPVPLAGVRVTGPGDQTATTEADGFFVLADVAPGEGVLRAEISSHTHALRPITVREDASLYVEVFLKAVSKATLDPAKGGVAKDKDSGATVTFPPDSLKRKDGSAPKGKVTVSVVAVSEGKAKAGSTRATQTDNSKGSLKGYTPVEMRVEDEDGERLQISEGKEVDVEFPISTKAANAPNETKLWSMSEKDGSWTQEVAEVAPTKTKNSEGQAVYKAKIKHMSWWAADLFVADDALTCVRGCVKQGEPAMASNSASVEISALGAPFAAVLSTDEKGCFYVDLEPGLEFSLAASNEFGASKVRSFTSGAETKTVAADKDACQDLGDVQLVANQPGAKRCPAGYELCGNTCVDLFNTTTQCGVSCSAAVDCSASNYPAGTACVAGDCRCAPGFSIVEIQQGQFECVDLQNDPRHCGAPSTVCNAGSGETCEGGQCVPLVCLNGNSVCTSFGTNVANCVDTKNDPLNCGSCAHHCQPGIELPSDVSPSYLCEESVCGCAAGTSSCRVGEETTFCVDFQTDSTNCGGCSSDMTGWHPEFYCDYATQVCMGGACVPKTCPQGQSLCSEGQCYDLNSDPNNCGACGQPCDDSQACINGTCGTPSCPAGSLVCGHQCVDPIDNNNCSLCDNICAFDGHCADVADVIDCYPLDCASQGKDNCYAHTCTDTSSDAKNCGSCGFICELGTCESGGCTCPIGKKPCNSLQGMICVPDADECTGIITTQL